MLGERGATPLVDVSSLLPIGRETNIDKYLKTFEALGYKGEDFVNSLFYTTGYNSEGKKIKQPFLEEWRRRSCLLDVPTVVSAPLLAWLGVQVAEQGYIADWLEGAQLLKNLTNLVTTTEETAYLYPLLKALGGGYGEDLEKEIKKIVPTIVENVTQKLKKENALGRYGKLYLDGGIRDPYLENIYKENEDIPIKEYLIPRENTHYN